MTDINDNSLPLRHLWTVLITFSVLSVITYFIPQLGEYRPIKDKNISTGLPWKIPEMSNSIVTEDNYTINKITPDEPKQVIPAIPDSLYADLPQSLEMNGANLKTFKKAIDELLSGKARDNVRIGYWGDSHVAEGTLVEAFRDYMQALFGDGGYGFMPIKRPYGRVEQNLYWKTDDNWEAFLLTVGEKKNGYYGYAGEVSECNKWAWVSYQAKTKDESNISGKVELFYLQHQAGGQVIIEIDTSKLTIDTKADSTQSAYFQTDIANYQSKVIVRSQDSGDNILFGMSLEAAKTGLVVDNLGILGMRSNRMLNHNEALFTDQLRHRDLKLGLMMFGGNEMGNKDGVDTIKFYNEYCKVIDMMRRAAPELPIILITPIDHGYKQAGKVISHPDIIKVVNTVRKVARDKQVILFDLWQAMGGDGSMGRWLDSSPKLGWSDYIHLTPAGYKLVSRYLFMAILEGYAKNYK
jgi:lysophospholipase L1-like esterase